ncbi:hypothetical protein SDC9_130818 [bioreactor metagenome]|uniref:Uncharacterized protein n=1 Tax=bioreactor metagenome TaxID=1076179 RepID=A0A645D3G8_9ZZZZ
MNIVEGADIVDDRHVRIAVMVGKQRLSFLANRQKIGIFLVVVGRELDEVDRHIGIPERLPPAVDQRLHVFLIEIPCPPVVFALVPDHAAHRQRGQRGHHGIVQHADRTRMHGSVQRQNIGWIFRRRQRQFLPGDRRFEFRLPIRISLADCRQPRLIFRGTRSALPHQCTEFAHRRNAVESGLIGPDQT